MPTARATNPKHRADVILQAGTKAHALGVLHQAVVAPRLPPNELADLAADLIALGVVIPGAMQARVELRAAISTQLEELRRGTDLAGAIRGSVRRAQAPKDVAKAYGVGVKINPEVAKSVLSVLGMIRDRALAFPAEPETLGIAAADLAAVTARIAAIDAAFTARRKKRAMAPTTTQTRNRTLNRVLQAVRRISAAGELGFVDDEELAERFRALRPPSPPTKSRRKPPAPSAPPPAPTEPPPA